MTGAWVTEDEYRTRGHTPEFDSLPILIVERVPVTEAPVSPDDLAFIKTMRQKKQTPPTAEEVSKMSDKELYETFGTRYLKNSN